ncbi:tyrosine-type recombinase/integrase [Lactococcus allomyrinae]|uniref:Site-specific integrase n=1 Tax=Lactococcus allomyrinae TaxID=2419773 RepID=A0A387BU46_9LACT|nr:site-specific integrase [Lactococcus allomyrinae]AYG01981.1 site-specific integrase [Lactococcus allomyrinae]
MNKLNIKEYKTKGGEIRYILRGAYIGIDKLTGKQVRTDVRGNTKKAVKTKLSRLQNDFIKNGCVKKEKQLKTFKDLAELWFDFYKKDKKPRSLGNIHSYLTYYILPSFGEYRLDKITPHIIQKQVNQWAETASLPIGNKSRRAKGKGRDYRLYFSITNRIFKYGLSLGIVSSNPCQNILIPKVKVQSTARQQKHLTKDELNQFFKHLEGLPKGLWTNEFMTALCRLLVASGLRIGEAFALNWEDLDFNNGTITVNKNVTLKQQIQDSPKTSKSVRVVHIDPHAQKILKSWWLFQQKYFMALGLPNQKLIFPKKTGGVADYNSFKRTLKTIFKGANVPDIGFHGFRHSHASLCLNAGMSYKVIQERLGHATLKMTMDTYSHLEPTKAENEMKLFSDFANF